MRLIAPGLPRSPSGTVCWLQPPAARVSALAALGIAAVAALDEKTHGVINGAPVRPEADRGVAGAVDGVRSTQGKTGPGRIVGHRVGVGAAVDGRRDRSIGGRLPGPVLPARRQGVSVDGQVGIGVRICTTQR